uniref:Mitochondrial Rho GTPase n=1 Tax=Stygiella incarcerata TaxID=1712417 RepID=A0A192ZIP7_9EUKA|nr:mitochondrial Rho GTPase [Stygiella incarcerata]|eukprot:TRINITY_DN145_c0_g1_i1.p1 TRINITY_DN145_c0_g1~~TRINITY_DN145_c0_g1_i1.p1  ORF type:complete len:631 (+),score=172.08 TRINITY_DN145_c0_g1_i1:94-1986(+)
MMDETRDLKFVLVGDKGVGKTSFCEILTSKDFKGDPKDEVSPPVIIPPGIIGGTDQITLLDTNAGDLESIERVLAIADAVFLFVREGDTTTVSNAMDVWLPFLRKNNVQTPLLIIRHQADRESKVSVEQKKAFADAFEAFVRMISDPFFTQNGVFISESSIKEPRLIWKTIFHARSSVLNPVLPIYDYEAKTFRPKAKRAFERIFRILDEDKDNSLNDAEMKKMQHRVFNTPFSDGDLREMRAKLKEVDASACDERGVTLVGFNIIMLFFVQKGACEGIWELLRKFGYNDDLELSPRIPEMMIDPEQCLEFSEKGREVMREIYDRYARDGSITHSQLASLLEEADNVFVVDDFVGHVNISRANGMNFRSFLSFFIMQLQLDYPRVAKAMFLWKEDVDIESLFVRSKSRSIDRKMHTMSRKLIRVFVFGSHGCGKTSLMNGLIRRKHKQPEPTKELHHVCGYVRHEGVEYHCMMTEIPQDLMEEVVSNKRMMMQCDVALMAYDARDAHSFQMLMVVQRKLIESRPSGVPSIYVLTKTDGDEDIVEQVSPVKPDVFCRTLGLPWPPVFSELNGDHVVAEDLMESVVQTALSPEVATPVIPTQSSMGSLVLTGMGVLLLAVGGYAVFKWFKRS